MVYRVGGYWLLDALRAIGRLAIGHSRLYPIGEAAYDPYIRIRSVSAGA